LVLDLKMFTQQSYLALEVGWVKVRLNTVKEKLKLKAPVK